MSSLAASLKNNSTNAEANTSNPSQITNVPSTKVGKYFSKECDAKIINITKATMVANELTNGVKMIVIEKPSKNPAIYSNMLAYYHPKNGGNMKEYITEIWFDQNTSWYKSKLVPSGIKYPSEWFMVLDIPDDPMGNYRLVGSFGSSVTIPGTDQLISTKRVPYTKF